MCYGSIVIGKDRRKYYTTVWLTSCGTGTSAAVGSRPNLRPMVDLAGLQHSTCN